MEINLSERDKKELESHHRVERDCRVRDRIKAVLLKSEGWTHAMIGQALRIHVDTVGQHLQDWQREQKLQPENGGSASKLNATANPAVSEAYRSDALHQGTGHLRICSEDLCRSVHGFWPDQMVKGTWFSV
jgi:hypothetical protein